ncbi:MAG: hypothetical protein ACKOWG_20460, partial [Planctomycetia bacterium]
RASWIVMMGWLLGWLLGWGWQAMPAVAAEAESAGSFLLYAPSSTEQRLLVVRARPAPGDGTGDQKTGGKNTATLEIVRTLGLGFAARTITAHPTRPLIYVSGVAVFLSPVVPSPVPSRDAGRARTTSSRCSVPLGA